MLPGEKLRQWLPCIYVWLPLEIYKNYAGKLWPGICHYISQEYPDYAELLTRENLAFRVAFRPRANAATLPGFNDTNHQTETLYFNDRLVSPNQTTTCALPNTTYIRQFLRMIVTVRWDESEFDPSGVVVHDRLRESLANLCKKSGIDI